jgi:hypothetical protein
VTAHSKVTVIPAQAGIQRLSSERPWVPAFAGTTVVWRHLSLNCKKLNSAAMAEADEIARTRRARFGTAAELFDDLEKNGRKQARPTAASGGLCS